MSLSSSIAMILSKRMKTLKPFSSITKNSRFHVPFSTTVSSSDADGDSDPFRALNSEESHSAPNATDSPSDSATNKQPIWYDRPLEKGLDVGIYKAILIGQVGQSPIQKRLRSGRNIVMFSLGTGGIRNNRRPLDNEDPRDYANRCAVQWHRVCVHPERLGEVVMKNTVPGSILYLEGNLETKIFSDPITGLLRRIREVVIRPNGRIVFLGNGGNTEQAKQPELKGIGNY